MWTLIGSALGFIGAAIPPLIDIQAKKQQNAHELEMLKLKNQQKRDDIQAKEGTELRDHDKSLNQGSGFINALQRSVRPVITYFFFLLFVTIEITLLITAIKTGVSFETALDLLWTEETAAMFAGIISFWFGSRAIEKMRNNT